MSCRTAVLFNLSAVGLLSLALHAPSVARALPIDDFSEANVSQITSPADGSDISVTDAGLDVLGGSRTTSLYTESQAVPGFDSATVSFFSDGQMSFLDNNSSAGWSGRVELSYDLTGNPLPAEDIGVAIDLLAYDGPAGELLLVTAWLDDLAGPTASVAAGPPQTLRVLFPAGISLAEELRIAFQVPAGGDFRVDAVHTIVPQPSTLVLAGLGIVGLSFAGRRL